MEISKQEVKALVFWAVVGGKASNGGSYGSILPDIIAKWSKKLKLSQDNFCSINYKPKELGKSIIKALNEKAGLRINK